MCTVGAAALGRERGGDGGRGVALTARVAALRLEHHLVRALVRLDDARRTLVLRSDRPHLDLDDAAVLVALDLLELRTGHARRDALDVEQHLPRLVDRYVDAELILDLH